MSTRDKVTPEDFGIGVSSLDQMQCYKHYSNYLQAELERAKVIHCIKCGDSWFDSGFTTSCPICELVEERKKVEDMTIWHRDKYSWLKKQFFQMIDVGRGVTTQGKKVWKIDLRVYGDTLEQALAHARKEDSL